MNIFETIKEASSVKQIRNSFDKATLVKIAKGALISGTGAVALYFLDYIGSMDFTDTNMAALVAFAVPFFVNLVKEYTKGSK